MKRPLLLVLVAVTALAALGFTFSRFFLVENTSTELHTLILRSPSFPDIVLDVEWAATENERSYGLMHRKFVDHGMLFFFEKTEPVSFWMKNTLVPLDIIFFDADGRYVSSTTMEPCTKDPCTFYPSQLPARYALEMPAGFLLKTPIDKDWKMVL